MVPEQKCVQDGLQMPVIKCMVIYLLLSILNAKKPPHSVFQNTTAFYGSYLLFNCFRGMLTEKAIRRFISRKVNYPEEDLKALSSKEFSG
jgi:hypothetical protein